MTHDFLSCQTLVEEIMSREIYENSQSLLREILTEMNTKVDAGLSFKFTPSEKSMSNLTASADGSLGYEKKTMIKQVSEITNSKVHARDMGSWHRPKRTRELRLRHNMRALTTHLLCTFRTRASCEWRAESSWAPTGCAPSRSRWPRSSWSMLSLCPWCTTRASILPSWRTMEPTTPWVERLAASTNWSTFSTRTQSKEKVCSHFKVRMLCCRGTWDESERLCASPLQIWRRGSSKNASKQASAAILASRITAPLWAETWAKTVVTLWQLITQVGHFTAFFECLHDN